MTAIEFQKKVEAAFADLLIDVDDYKYWVPFLLEGETRGWYDKNVKYMGDWSHFSFCFIQQVGEVTDAEVLNRMRTQMQPDGMKALEYVKKMELKFGELAIAPPEHEQV